MGKQQNTYYPTIMEENTPLLTSYTSTNSFNSEKITTLYNILHDKEFLDNYKTPISISNVLYPYIESIINDPDAYNEAKQWNSFASVVEHIEDNNIIFKNMDKNISMCFSLFMYEHH